MVIINLGWCYELCLLVVSLFMLLSLRASLYWEGALEGNTAANRRVVVPTICTSLLAWCEDGRYPHFPQWCDNQRVSWFAVCSWGAQFKSQLRHKLLSVKVFLNMPVPPGKCREYLKLGHGHTLPHTLHSFFFLILSSYVMIFSYLLPASLNKYM